MIEGARQPASLSRVSKRNRLAAGPEAARPRRRFHRDFESTGNVNRHVRAATQVDVEVVRRACEAQAIGGIEAVMSLDGGAELDPSSVGGIAS